MTDLGALLPHAGAMVLLDGVERWDAAEVVCWTRSHLDPANPLRRAGRLAACCGLEYGLQAAALHGALRDGGRAQAAGYVAALRGVVLGCAWLDEAGFGTLRVVARLEAAAAEGMLYGLEVRSAADVVLVSGRASVALGRAA